MYNLRIIKASNDLKDGINCSDVRKKSISETGSGGSSSSQAGDIVDGQVGRYFGLWLVLLTQPIVPIIRYDDSGFFRINCGVWKVLYPAS